jgi:hypothetical protein
LRRFYFEFTAYGKSHPSISEEELKEKYANLNGNVVAEGNLPLGSSHLATVGITSSGSATVENHSGTMQRGMVLPFAPLSLTFNNIKYFVDMPQVSIEIISVYHQ